jgi:hypothetical protein
MQHDQILKEDSYNKVDIAAVWPASVQVAPLPVPDIEERAAAEPFVPTPSSPDVPVAVGGLIVVSYVALIAAFALATVGSGQSIFAITISALFLMAFFTVPRVFLGMEPKQGRRPSFDRFMSEGMETLTGHCSGGAALTQMLIVPVSLTLGTLVIAVAASFIF